MRYSKLFGKTIKDPPKDATLISHKLLYKAGFIRESTAGRYYFLPLGNRVHQKIQKIIKEEMDSAGAQEILTPVLHPIDLWKETNRTKTVGFELMIIKDRNKTGFVLGGTAEEMLVDLVRKFQVSYKDLPFNLYQFSTKFRDELRARGGLLRLKEFIMKDAYSFHTSEEDFKKEYENMASTYTKIFKRLGLNAIRTESDNGYIGGDYGHEFQVVAQSGEDEIIYCPGGDYSANIEVAKVSEGKQCDLGHGPLKKVKSIEVGNIFQLGYYYSSKMHDAVFSDHKGSKKQFYMGCYGIGLARTLATIVEVHNDEKGIVWPESVAPYQVHLIEIRNPKSEIPQGPLVRNKSKNQNTNVRNLGDKIYEELEKAGVEVLYDDRGDVSVGQKFADADLIGIPVRLVVSEKTSGKVEWKKRTESKTELVGIDETIRKLEEIG